MEMTIDESLKILDHYNHGFCEYSAGLSGPIKVAVDTMQKYQKIEKIVKKWKADTLSDVISYDCMIEIREVMEND